MNYKKAYKKAIKIARELKEQHRQVVLTIFPELEESEDERIRKELLEHCKKVAKVFHHSNTEKEYKDTLNWIAWLEKQGEQTTADKVEQKFKVGDWCIDNTDGTIFQIVKVLDNTYAYKTNEGEEYYCTHYSLENDAHLWTIKDAKDGDVLYHSDTASNGIFIFKGLLKYEFSEKVICYCDYDSEDGFCLGESRFCCWSDAKILHPATKEQRELFFQEMREAGYEWDSDTKELKGLKMIDDHKDYNSIDPHFGKQIEMIPYWSREDISKVQRICKYLDESKKYYADITEVRECIDWLKSLKQRIRE